MQAQWQKVNDNGPSPQSQVISVTLINLLVSQSDAFYNLLSRPTITNIKDGTSVFFLHLHMDILAIYIDQLITEWSATSFVVVLKLMWLFFAALEISLLSMLASCFLAALLMWLFSKYQQHKWWHGMAAEIFSLYSLLLLTLHPSSSFSPLSSSSSGLHMSPP